MNLRRFMSPPKAEAISGKAITPRGKFVGPARDPGAKACSSRPVPVVGVGGRSGPVRAMAQTLFDKIWDAHLVARRAAGRELIYIDRHALHDLHAPQPFHSL